MRPTGQRWFTPTSTAANAYARNTNPWIEPPTSTAASTPAPYFRIMATMRIVQVTASARARARKRRFGDTRAPGFGVLPWCQGPLGVASVEGWNRSTHRPCRAVRPGDTMAATRGGRHDEGRRAG